MSLRHCGLRAGPISRSVKKLSSQKQHKEIQPDRTLGKYLTLGYIWLSKSNFNRCLERAKPLTNLQTGAGLFRNATLQHRHSGDLRNKMEGTSEHHNSVRRTFHLQWQQQQPEKQSGSSLIETIEQSSHEFWSSLWLDFKSQVPFQIPKHRHSIVLQPPLK